LSRFAGDMPNPDSTVVGQNAEAPDLLEEEQLRANVYALLSALLISPPDETLLAVVKGLEGDDSDFGMALGGLALQANELGAEEIVDEFTRLFYGHGAGGELHPYASFYLTGFIYGKPLADLRQDMGVLGRARTDVTSEPEDHIAILLNAVHDLITGTQGDPLDLDGQKDFFDKHVAPWAGKFFEDLENAENAGFYRPVGTIGRLLMEIEGRAFTIAA